MLDKSAIQEIENIVGYVFKDKSYLIRAFTHPSLKAKVEEKSWFKAVTVEKDGEQVPLTKGGMYVYENRYVFPGAFVVDDYDYQFIHENNSSAHRTENQLALYHFLGGDKTVTQLTGSNIKALAADLWTRSGEERWGGTEREAPCTCALPPVEQRAAGERLHSTGAQSWLCTGDLEAQVGEGWEGGFRGRD